MCTPYLEDAYDAIMALILTSYCYIFVAAVSFFAVGTEAVNVVSSVLMTS